MSKSQSRHYSHYNLLTIVKVESTLLHSENVLTVDPNTRFAHFRETRSKTPSPSHFACDLSLNLSENYIHMYCKIIDTLIFHFWLWQNIKTHDYFNFFTAFTGYQKWYVCRTLIVPTCNLYCRQLANWKIAHYFLSIKTKCFF